MIIDNEFRSLIPPLSTDEYSKLEESILKEGCREPLIVWNETLIDGHNRLEICTKHGLPYKVQKIEGIQDRTDAKVWIRNNQMGRRNLTDAWKIELALANKEDLLKKGRKVMAETHTKASVSQNDILENPHSTRKTVAGKAGVSTGLVAEAEIVRKKSPELWNKAKEGKVTITKAYNDIKREELKKEVIEKLEDIKTKETKEIKGVYDVIVVDPPWQMKKIERDVAPNQVEFDYPTMTIEEIKELKIPCADDCHVWLWTTHKYLPDAFEILKDWGLKYVCTFVWHKNGGFQPFDLPQYNCEFVLYARKGTPKFIDLKDFKVCFNAQRGKHSEKPEEFYELVKRVTAGRRIDMFNRRPIDGFDTWGKEAQ